MPLATSNKVYQGSNSATAADVALTNKISPSALIGPFVNKPKAPVAAKPAAIKPVASIAPAASPAGATTFAVPPAYDNKTGLLTDYGKSQGMPEINGKQAAYVPPSSTGASGSAKTGKEAATKETPSFGGILFDLLKKATEGSQGVQNAREALTKFQTGTADTIADIKSQAIPLEFQQGRAQVVQQASAEKEAALQTGVQNALTDQGQQLNALGAAAGQAAPQQLGSGSIYIDPVTGKPIAGGPTQVPYSNQFIDPITGQPVGGGAATGTLQQAVASIAEKVKNGSMGYDDGLKALQGYGQAGTNGLQAALGPNFNVQQSNATAAAQAASTLQTGTLGGQLQKQAETVKTHMGTLKTSYDALGAKYGIPLLNAGINAIAKQFGSGPLQSYNIALSNVRDELAKILGGGTSTDGTRATAAALLPDNMTPAQIDAAIKTATELMNAKIEEYTKIPQFNNNGAPSGGSGGQYDW